MKTSSIRNQIGVFCQCVLLYTKPPGKTSAPPLNVPLFAGEVHDIVKSVCRISRKNLASGQTQQNFSFIQAERGRKSGASRRGGKGRCSNMTGRPGNLRAYHAGRGTGDEVRHEPKQDDGLLSRCFLVLAKPKN